MCLNIFARSAPPATFPLAPFTSIHFYVDFADPQVMAHGTKLPPILLLRAESTVVPLGLTPVPPLGPTEKYHHRDLRWGGTPFGQTECIRTVSA